MLQKRANDQIASFVTGGGSGWHPSFTGKKKPMLCPSAGQKKKCWNTVMSFKAKRHEDQMPSPRVQRELLAAVAERLRRFSTPPLSSVFISEARRGSKAVTVSLGSKLCYKHETASNFKVSHAFLENTGPAWRKPGSALLPRYFLLNIWVMFEPFN